MSVNSLCFILVLITGPLNAIASSVSDKQNKPYQNLETFQWMHGSKSCKTDPNPSLQVVQANSSSYVIRQSKCSTFEAPFIYVLFGKERVLVVDTGAIKSSEKSPVYKTIRSLITQNKFSLENSIAPILVVHTHGHNDHIKGDVQFNGKLGVKLVHSNAQSLEDNLGLKDWPNTTSRIDLGDRVVTFIPTPGHQDQSITIYDDRTGWLLTGDTLYPGSIRVSDWTEYRNSIKGLSQFSQNKSVSLILGAHIEMNAATKKPYRVGKKYQPEEPPLGLSVKHLEELSNKLQLSDKPKKLKFDSFVVSPLTKFERTVIKLMTKKNRSKLK